MAQTSHPFIITTPLQQPDAASKRNARSYAMRGKNRGKSGRRRVHPPCLSSWIDGSLYERAKQRENLIPRHVGSEWKVGRLAEGVEPDMFQNILKFTAILERAANPNPILARDDATDQASVWIGYLDNSETFFHCQLFVTLSYFNMISTGYTDIGSVARLHMTKALGFLQADLATTNRATTDATLSVITSFAMVALVAGDKVSANSHLHGLFKLVEMRGGLPSLREHRYLQTKCCKIDLAYAISTCSKPLFFADDISWECYLPRSITKPLQNALHSVLPPSAKPDTKSLNIWHDLYEISRAANIATQIGRMLEANLLQEVMISIQYRLLHLQYRKDDIHELLRMVMLGYSITIFPVLISQFNTMHLTYPSIPSSLQDLLRISKEMPIEKLNALLWVLFITKLSILGNKPTDMQFSQVLKQLGLRSWDEILIILKGYLWIDVIHTDKAKRIYDQIGPESA